MQPWSITAQNRDRHAVDRSRTTTHIELVKHEHRERDPNHHRHIPDLRRATMPTDATRPVVQDPPHAHRLPPEAQLMNPARAGALVDAVSVALIGVGIDGGYDSAGDHQPDHEHLRLIATAAANGVMQRLVHLITDTDDVIDLDAIANELDRLTATAADPG